MESRRSQAQAQVLEYFTLLSSFIPHPILLGPFPCCRQAGPLSRGHQQEAGA